MDGAALRIEGPQKRLTVRDADDVPLVGLHKEDGAVVTVHLPERWATRAAVEERDPSSSHVVNRFALDVPRAEPKVLLAELLASPPAGAARGASDVFRMLFAVPFGPRAMGEAVVEANKEDAAAVYGVSEDEVERMRILLAQAAGSADGRRITLGVGFLSFGAVLGSAGGWLISRDSDKAYPYLVAGYGGVPPVVRAPPRHTCVESVTKKNVSLPWPPFQTSSVGSQAEPAALKSVPEPRTAVM